RIPLSPQGQGVYFSQSIQFNELVGIFLCSLVSVADIKNFHFTTIKKNNNNNYGSSDIWSDGIVRKKKNRRTNCVFE
ncbi:MAG: hypothetical protein WCQ55_07225, partial [Paludibacteraceae bacterium]